MGDLAAVAPPRATALPVHRNPGLRPDPPVRRAGGVTRAPGPLDRAGMLQLQRHAGNAAVSRLLTLQRCGPIPPEDCPCHAEEGSDEVEAAPAAAPTAQRVVQGDIRQISITTGWARALTDTELAEQTAILRGDLVSLPADNATARQGTQENLRVLEDEARRRTAAQALAGMTLGPDVARPPGVPADGGYALMEIPGVNAESLAQLPEGQIATVHSAALFAPPGAAGANPVVRGGEALGVGGGAANLASGMNMARFGFPGGAQGQYTIGIIVRPRSGVSGALNLDWGHTSLVLRRGGAPLEAIGFNPDMRTAGGLVEMVSNAKGIERGTYATGGRFTPDTRMFGVSDAVHIEYPISEVQAAEFTMQQPGLSSTLRYTGRPAVFSAGGNCNGSNCGLWAIGEVENQTGGTVGRVGDPAGITAMGENGVVQAGRGSQPAIVSLAEGGLENPGTIRPLLPGGAAPTVSGMPPLVRVLRVGGKVMLVVGIAVSVYEVATASPENRGRVTAGVVGGFAGGFALGAAAGLVCGPGAPLCSGLLGLTLGVVGAIGGRYVGEEAYDLATAPPDQHSSASGSGGGGGTPGAGGPGPQQSWEMLFVPPPTPQDQLFNQIVLGGSPLIRPATSIDLAFSGG